MRFEVEQKYPVGNLSDVQRKLVESGASFGPPVFQADTYFAHPARNFDETDEALRIRRVRTQNYVTYKGPKVDKTTKTRRELEISLPGGEQGAGDFAELLGALGFTVVAEVRKRRRTSYLKWKGRDVEAVLDEVEELGTFVELEMAADAESLDEVRDALLDMAGHLGLEDAQRRSYLELLLESRGQA